MEQEKGLLRGWLLLLFAVAGWGTNPGPHAESSDRLGHQSRVKIPEARSGLIIKGRWTRTKREKKAKCDAQAGDEEQKNVEIKMMMKHGRGEKRIGNQDGGKAQL